MIAPACVVMSATAVVGSVNIFFNNKKVCYRPLIDSIINYRKNQPRHKNQH